MRGMKKSNLIINFLKVAIPILSFVSISKAQLADTQDRAELVDRLRSQTLVIMQPGNTPNSIIPELPKEVLKNTEIADLYAQRMQNDLLIQYYVKKYNRIVNTLFTNYNTDKFRFKTEVLKAAKNFNIDPLHIVAAVVGEHVFNVDIKDTVQDYFVKARIWTSYFQEQHPFVSVMECPELKVCEKQPSDYFKWSCYDSNWNAYMRNKKACGQSEAYANRGFVMSFFDPTLGGKTYGLGQLGPVKVLSLNDLVHAKSGLPLLSIKDVSSVYQTTLDPNSSIHYIAAAAFNSIEIYKKYTGFDISKNIGLTATLYNLGYEYRKANELKSINGGNMARGKDIKIPQVNYYGWFINYVEKDLRERFNKLK